MASEQIVVANRIDYAGRLQACLETPLINPDQIPLKVEVYLN